MALDYATYYGDTTIGSLMGKDPKRTSTVTMHVPTNLDATGRCPGIKSHHFGPGKKVVGGEVRYAYEERAAGKEKLDPSKDPAKMYAHMKSVPDTLRRPQTDTLYASLSRRHQQPEPGMRTQRLADTATASTSGRGGAMPPAGALSSDPPATTSSAPATLPNGIVPKIVFWDGKQHHVMDTIHMQGQETGKNGEWVPPHLTRKDVEPGPFLGVRETPGSIPTNIIGSKHRRMPDWEGAPKETPGEGWHTAAWASGVNTANLQNSTVTRRNTLYHSWAAGPRGPALTGRLGVAPYAPTQFMRSFGPGEDIDEGAAREYAKAKLMGHKEYEETVRQYDGIGCFTAAQTNLTSSMQIGRPSRQLSPYEHSTMKLSSIRRPHTSHF